MIWGTPILFGRSPFVTQQPRKTPGHRLSPLLSVQDFAQLRAACSQPEAPWIFVWFNVQLVFQQSPTAPNRTATYYPHTLRIKIDIRNIRKPVLLMKIAIMSWMSTDPIIVWF